MVKKTVCCIIVLCAFLAYASERPLTVSGFQYRGLTGTIDWLIDSRPRANISIGSSSYDVDALITGDLAGLISCDILLSEYLESGEGVNYEQLSDIIKQKIYDNLEGVCSSVFPYVVASEEGDIVRIGISIEFERNILLPIRIETEEQEVKVSFNYPCVVDFGIDISIEVDSGKTLEDDPFKGVSACIDRLTVTLRSAGEMGDAVIPALYNGEFQYMRLADFNVEATFGWYLGDADQYISYESIAGEDYAWQLVSSGSASLSLTVDDEVSGETLLGFAYSVDDLTEYRDPCLEVYDEGESSRYSIRMEE